MKSYNIKERIKEYFFMNPTAKMRVRQIERELKLPLPSVIRYCKELEKEGILNKIVISGIKFYAADRTNKRFLVKKLLYNIGSLYESKLIDGLILKYSNPTIVLFGSYSKGEDTEGSDIDLYMETPSKISIMLSEFEKKLHRKIQLFIYRGINQVENKKLANNILNGIVLNGFVEVFK
ncbi:MAG: nucleotidyltransferase domain-containing protein [Nanoarchaeota archaeon]